jgi:hypothetical protein
MPAPPVTWRWYVARTRAMSPREILWRSGEAVKRPLLLARRTPTRPRWDDSAWSDALRRLVARHGDACINDAERIAEGWLELWGHQIRIDLRDVDWFADPLDGVRLPTSSWRRWQRDPKPLWELHRQQHVVPLAAGAALAGREDWARLAVDHLLAWAAHNPPSRGPGWSSAYETAHRLVGWAFALPLLRWVLEPSELARLDEAYARQAAFVAARPSRFSSANNHRIAELVGLLASARVGAAGLEWRPLWQELEAQIERQTYADGGTREQAAGYFLYVLELLWVAGVLAQSVGHSLGRVEERLRAMLGWLAAVADEYGEPPPVGDDAEDRMLRLDYFKRRRAAAIAANARMLVDYEGEQQHQQSIILDASGYAVLRASRTRVVFDVGELGFGSLAAHGHADALAVLVDVEGASVLRDSGTGAYAPITVRERFRATGAHNTVVVDGASQAEALGPHIWGRRFRTTLEAAHVSAQYDAVRASHDGYPGALHTRTVVFAKPDLLVVLDRVVSGRPREAQLVWQPWGTPALAVASLPEATRAEDSGPWSPRYNSVDEALRLTWTARGNPVIFVTALSLTGASTPITLSEEGGAIVVEIDQPRKLRITEHWAGPVAEVEI